MTCPTCGSENAAYQIMSGGKEGYCPDCDDNFPLSMVPVEQRPIATLLQTDAGRVALRAAMDQRLARLRDES